MVTAQFSVSFAFSVLLSSEVSDSLRVGDPRDQTNLQESQGRRRWEALLLPPPGNAVLAQG